MNDAPEAPVVELFAGVDDLIRRVADTENPEIRKIRAKVYAALVLAKSSFDRSANQMRRQASQVVPRVVPRVVPPCVVPRVIDTDEYLEEYPGPALGIALLVGLGLGLVVSLRQ
jgi:ElaB/YqjD/DUF883 family membrane-anchored ribosome-binding protein